MSCRDGRVFEKDRAKKRLGYLDIFGVFIFPKKDGEPRSYIEFPNHLIADSFFLMGMC